MEGWFNQSAVGEFVYKTPQIFSSSWRAKLSAFSQVSAAPITIAHGVHSVARSTAQTAFKLIRSRDQFVLPMHKVPAGRSA